MASESNSESEWASLPEELLDSILGHLASMADCIRFSAVCSDWRRIAYQNYRNPPCDPRRCHQLPLLMVPTPDSSTDTRSLYDVRRKRLYDFRLKVPYHRRCAGSSHGWLIFVHDSYQVTLFNPFSGKSIHLPPIRRLFFEKRIRDEVDEMSVLPDFEKYQYEKKLRDEYDEEEEEYVPDIDEIVFYNDGEDEGDGLEQDKEEEEESRDPEFGPERFHESEYSVVRGVLSTNPEINPNGYFLMVIYGTQSRLAFVKSGDEYWTYIDKSICDQNVRDVVEYTYVDRGLWYRCDIVYHNGLFYVLDHLGVLLSCDVNTNLKVEKITGIDTLHNDSNHKSYLVESSEGDLLRVVRVIEYDYGYGMTIKFVVYKLVDFCGDPHWTEVNSLGNDALFLGDNHSIAVIASDFIGCQFNSIYFCDDCDDFYNYGGPNDIGVFNLQDGCVRRHYTLAHSQRLMPPSIWISPTFL